MSNNTKSKTKSDSGSDSGLMQFAEFRGVADLDISIRTLNSYYEAVKEYYVLDPKTTSSNPFPYPFPSGALRGDSSLHQNITTFSCKYCEFQNTSRYDYDKHTVIRHSNQPGYPDRNGRT
jgi:hypothetical protein